MQAICIPIPETYRFALRAIALKGFLPKSSGMLAPKPRTISFVLLTEYSEDARWSPPPLSRWPSGAEIVGKHSLCPKAASFCNRGAPKGRHQNPEYTRSGASCDQLTRDLLAAFLRVHERVRESYDRLDIGMSG